MPASPDVARRAPAHGGFPASDLAGGIDALTAEIAALRSDMAATRAVLDGWAWQQAALLPSRVVETVTIVSGQQVGPAQTATSTTVKAQTGDVEIVEGILLGATGGAPVVNLTLDDSVTLQVTAPTVLSPLSLPVGATHRTLTWVSGSFTSITAVIWGRVAPARTGVVH